MIARKLGAQALWLSLAIGVILAATIAVLATPIVSLVGRRGPNGRLRGDVPPHRLDRHPFLLPRPRRAGIPARCRGASLPARPDRARQRAQRGARGALRLRLRLGNRGVRLGHRGGAVVHGGRVRLADRPTRGPGRSRAGPLARRAADLGRQVPLRSHRVPDRRVPARRSRGRTIRRRRARRVPDLVSALDLPRARARRDRDRGADHRRPRARRRAPRACVRRQCPDDRARRRRRCGLRGRAPGALRRPPARLHRRRGRPCAMRAPLADLRADAATQRRRLRARRNPDRRGRRPLHRRLDGRGLRCLHRRARRHRDARLGSARRLDGDRRADPRSGSRRWARASPVGAGSSPAGHSSWGRRAEARHPYDLVQWATV